MYTQKQLVRTCMHACNLPVYLPMQTMQTYSQPDSQAASQTGGQADRQTDRQTDRPTDRHTDRQTAKVSKILYLSRQFACHKPDTSAWLTEASTEAAMATPPLQLALELTREA